MCAEKTATKTPGEKMVKHQLKNRGINDPKVLKAFSDVAREKFVADKYQHRAYEDNPLPLLAGQTISQPYIVAYMIQALGLKPGDKVLEVGAGSGYAAAIMAHIADQVFSVERLHALVEIARANVENAGIENVEICEGDGTLGLEEQAPFDAILVSAGGPLIPRTLEMQLKIGGRMIIPVGANKHVQNLVRITRDSETEFSREDLTDVRFVPLIGEAGWKAHEIDDLISS